MQATQRDRSGLDPETGLRNGSIARNMSLDVNALEVQCRNGVIGEKAPAAMKLEYVKLPMAVTGDENQG